MFSQVTVGGKSLLRIAILKSEVPMPWTMTAMSINASISAVSLFIAKVSL